MKGERQLLPCQGSWRALSFTRTADQRVEGSGGRSEGRLVRGSSGALVHNYGIQAALRGDVKGSLAPASFTQGCTAFLSLAQE